MKIAFLAAANSIHSIRWIKFFADRGHTITWITLAPPNKDAEKLLRSHGKNIKFFAISPSPLADISGSRSVFYLPSAVRRIRKILSSGRGSAFGGKKERPDVLHIHSAGTYGLVGALAGFHPTILTPWGSDILLNTGFKKWLVSYVIRHADYFTCDGENTREKLIELGAAREKIELIRFGVDIKKFPAVRNRSTAHDKPVTIISLRTLIPVYDIETLIKAAAIVLKKILNAKFIIAGDGDQRPYLEKLAKDLSISNSVTFTGKYSPDKLPDMFQDADIYVSTALSDSGLSASTAEAMAAGLPVVVSDSGDNREWVEDGSTGSPRPELGTKAPQAGGFVFPCKDSRTLAEKLLFLIKNKEARALFGAYNRKIIEEKNNYYLEMDKVEKIYQELA